MKIDGNILAELNKFNDRLGWKRALKSIGYERSAELPYIISLLQNKFAEEINMLDIGSGDSVLPAFLLAKTNWQITCLDKYEWVEQQRSYIQKAAPEKNTNLHVVKKNLFEYRPEGGFDVITCISVIEHFSDHQDAEAMRMAGAMLKPRGLFILTTPVNEGYAEEFYKSASVYGESSGERTFYQRHYDIQGIIDRLIVPSGLREVSRTYFGEYGFPFGEKIIFPPVRKNPLKIFYKWLSPMLAKQFVTYSDRPVSRKDMSVDTASGIILVLTRD